jgi:hypothetical protein
MVLTLKEFILVCGTVRGLSKDFCCKRVYSLREKRLGFKDV